MITSLLLMTFTWKLFSSINNNPLDGEQKQNKNTLSKTEKQQRLGDAPLSPQTSVTAGRAADWLLTFGTCSHLCS